jgi:polyhydroxyalkanoate synthase
VVVETLRRTKNAVQATAHALRVLNGATQHTVPWCSGSVSLRHYKARTTPLGPPLLLITPIINRFRVVDLQAGGSLVESLVTSGVDVYVVDWGAPSRIDAGTDWEDYVLRLLPRMLDVIVAESELPAGVPEGTVDVMGYCLGGTIAVLLAATSPQRVRRLVTLATPIDFHTGVPHMDLIGKWVAEGHFPVELITRAFGNFPARLIQQGFLWQRPLSSALKFRRAWKRFGKRDFARLFCALESWNQDGVDVPGAAYRRLIVDFYRENRLAKGTFVLGGERVDLERIRCPLLVITAANDTTCPPVAAHALLELVGTPAEQRRALDLPGGHVTVTVGSKSAQRLHAPLADWLRA